MLLKVKKFGILRNFSRYFLIKAPMSAMVGDKIGTRFEEEIEWQNMKRKLEEIKRAEENLQWKRQITPKESYSDSSFTKITLDPEDENMRNWRGQKCRRWLVGHRHEAFSSLTTGFLLKKIKKFPMQKVGRRIKKRPRSVVQEQFPRLSFPFPY